MDEAGTLTRADLLAALEKLREIPPPHQHVVHPRSQGWTICGSCLAPVYVGERNR